MDKQATKKPLNSNLLQIIAATHHDPFSVLGRHVKNNKTTITAFLPYAESVHIVGQGEALSRIPDTDFFECELSATFSAQHYQLEGIDKEGKSFKF